MIPFPSEVRAFLERIRDASDSHRTVLLEAVLAEVLKELGREPCNACRAMTHIATEFPRRWVRAGVWHDPEHADKCVASLTVDRLESVVHGQGNTIPAAIRDLQNVLSALPK